MQASRPGRSRRTPSSHGRLGPTVISPRSWLRALTLVGLGKRRPTVAVYVALMLPALGLFGGQAIPVYAATAPPTLSGETLSGTPLLTPACNATGTSTTTFTASGTATGPYAGTFTASGSWSIGSGTDVPLLTFQETFSVSSPTGAVTGTKDLATPNNSSSSCGTNGGGLLDYVNQFTANYRATIIVTSGTFADQGTAIPDIQYGSGVGTFGETFGSALTMPTPVVASPAITAEATVSANVGGTISDIAILSAGNAPTGAITFGLFSPTDSTCSAAAVFTSIKTVTGNGTYPSDPYLATLAGSYRWIASYSGDANNNPATTACNDAGETSAVMSDTDLGLTGVPADITTNATGTSGAVVSYSGSGAVDEAGDSPAAIASCTPASGATFAIGTSTVTCTASDTDDAPSTASQSFTVTVSDTDLGLTGVPADITANATGTSGAVVSYSAPGAVDEAGDSPAAIASCTPASGSTFAIGTSTVTCTTSDTDDAPNTVIQTFTVTVAGPPATLQVGGTTFIASEGSAFDGSVASFTGVDPADVANDYTASIDWGDGSSNVGTVSGGNGNFTVSGSHIYADEGLESVITKVRRLADNATGSAVSAANVADADVLGVGKAGQLFIPAAGQPFNGVVANFSDSYSANSASDFTASIDWGDGSSSSAGTVSSVSGQLLVSGTHTYASTGSYTVQATLQDDGGNASFTASLTAQVGLSGSGANFSATEGSPVGGVATFTVDPGDQASDFTASIDWGDGSSSGGRVVLVAPGQIQVGSAGHIYSDETNLIPYLVSTTLTRRDGATGTVQVYANVADADVLGVGKAGQLFIPAAGQPFNGVVANFSDSYSANSASDFTASIDWGDGSSSSAGTVSSVSGQLLVSGTHTYASTGSYTVQATLQDDGGNASFTASLTAQVGTLSTTVSTPSTTTGTLTPIPSGGISIGTAIYDQVAVSGGSSNVSPSGTVDVYICSPAALSANSASTCSSTFGSLLDAQKLPPGSLVFSSGLKPNSQGTWCFASYYSGDPDFVASADTSNEECFTVRATLVSIAVTPADSSLVRGLNAQFVATGTYADASTADLTATVAWASSNTAVATISGGLAEAMNLGTTTISATDGSVVGSTSFTVVAGALDHLVLGPATATIIAGGSQRYTAEGFDKYDDDLGDMTSSTTFSISPDGSCTAANCSTTVAGSHTVTGTAGTATGTASLTVNTAALDHLALSPASSSITAGGSQSYTAEGFDQYGNDLGNVTSGTVFSIGPDGSCTLASCTATLAGIHTVTGTDASATGTATLTVNPGPLAYLVLSPSSSTITAGGSQSYTATGFDQYGNSLGDVTGATTFTIALNGSCTGTTCTATVAGAHTVTGTDGGKTGTATLTVNRGPLDHLVLSPSSSTITAGGSQSYTAAGFDQYGNSLGNVTPSTIFSIAPNGSCTLASCIATVAGAHTITSTDSGKTGTAGLTVIAAGLDHLVLTPASTTITAGGSQSYTAAGFDQYGNSLGNVTSSTIFSIAPNGSCTLASCTATVAGAHTITGTDSGKTGTANLTVTTTTGSDLRLAISTTPSTATTGTVVTASISLTNTASVSRTVTLVTTFSYVSPTGQVAMTSSKVTITLAAGQTVTRSFTFKVASYFPRGTYSFSTTASDVTGPVSSSTTFKVK